MVKAITVDAMEVHETAGAAAIAAQANQPVNPIVSFEIVSCNGFSRLNELLSLVLPHLPPDL